jgi:hypothetical protein
MKVKPEAATAVIELLMMGGEKLDMLSSKLKSGKRKEKLLHQVSDLFELNVKLRCQNVKLGFITASIQ